MIETREVHDAVRELAPALATPDVSLIHAEVARRNRARRQVTAVGAALLLTVGVVAAMQLVGRSDRTPLDTTAATTDSSSAPEPSVTQLDPAEEPPSVTETTPPGIDTTEIPTPSPARAGHTVTWTGSEVLVFGGWEDENRDQAFNDGHRFNPDSRAWSQLPAAPFEARGGHVAFWTGEELLVLGGVSGRIDSHPDGAAYDPVTDSWRPIAGPNIEPAASSGERLLGVWTGSEAILWYRSDDTILAFNPTTNTWRNLPPTGLDQAVSLASLHWDGDRLIALSGESPSAPEGAVLTIGNDSWRPLPPLPTSSNFSDPFPSNAGIVNGDLILWTRSGEQGSTVRLARGTLEWEEVATIPLAACEGHPPPLSTGEALIVWELCGTGTIVTYTEAESWQRVDSDNDVQINAATAVWTGTEVITLPTTCCFGAAGTEQWELAIYQLDQVAEASAETN